MSSPQSYKSLAAAASTAHCVAKERIFWAQNFSTCFQYSSKLCCRLKCSQKKQQPKLYQKSSTKFSSIARLIGRCRRRADNFCGRRARAPSALVLKEREKYMRNLSQEATNLPQNGILLTPIRRASAWPRKLKLCTIFSMGRIKYWTKFQADSSRDERVS